MDEQEKWRKHDNSCSCQVISKAFFFLKEDVSHDRTINYWVPSLICLKASNKIIVWPGFLMAEYYANKWLIVSICRERTNVSDCFIGNGEIEPFTEHN